MMSEENVNIIPQSLEECYERDSTTISLWNWKGRMETIGKVLFCIIIIGGIVLAIISSITVTNYGTYYQYTSTSFSFGTFLAAIISAGLWAIVEYILYHIFALLLGAMSNIVHNTRVTARVALFNSKNALNSEQKEEKIEN